MKLNKEKVKDEVINRSLKKNIQLYALIVNLPIGINLPERRNKFFYLTQVP
jgi:hypothetical protein